MTTLSLYHFISVPGPGRQRQSEFSKHCFIKCPVRTDSASLTMWSSLGPGEDSLTSVSENGCSLCLGKFSAPLHLSPFYLQNGSENCFFQTSQMA